eukprot:m.168781 g.168781  ORF g.168781 m.168781 type:complete len:650 (-) comp14483_c2_seq1:53-2002(-)
MALNACEYELGEDVLRLCGPGIGLKAVSFLHEGPGGVVYQVSDGEIASIGDEQDKCSFSFDNVWSAGRNSLLVQQDNELKLYSLEKKQVIDTVTTLPDNIREIDATYSVTTGVTVALFQETPEAKDKPVVFPRPPRSISLMVFSTLNGWQTVATLPDTCERLRISGNGKRVAFADMANYIPEEGERGEFFVCDTYAAAKPLQVTSHAGRVGDIVLNQSGTLAYFQANYSRDRPITTHVPLWACALPPCRTTPQPLGSASEATTQSPDHTRSLISEAEACVTVVCTFGEGQAVFTVIEGCTEVSYYIAKQGSPPQKLPNAVTGACIATLSGLVYVSESQTEFPFIARIQLPSLAAQEPVQLAHDPEWDAFVMEVFTYTSHDGKMQDSFHCYKKGTPSNAPLLVHAHGGPAVGFASRRSLATNNVRYTYRQMLQAGYRVIMPLFRGTLGYGNDFAQANIGCQGQESSDLGDILAAIEYLRTAGYDFKDNVGIFGGSYGGYMTMQCLATTKAFKAGVAMYGFIHGRFMSLEGGDFTWEDEYVGAQSWPLTADTTASDVFHNLGNITQPTLFLHGDDDPICMKSGSIVAYRALATRGIPTGCVLYPGEGHGFDQPQHQRDRDIRTVQWFLTHLPLPDKPSESLRQVATSTISV